MAAACQVLAKRWPDIEAHELALLRQLRTGLREVPGLSELSIFDGPRVGVVSFTIKNHDAGLIAAALSAEYGIGIRDGAFCAHIATHRLLAEVGSTQQRALRASLGLGSTAEHVDRLVNALRTLVTKGPELSYRLESGQWVPERDNRTLPSFLAG